MVDKYETVILPTQFDNGTTEKCFKFKLWGKATFNAPFSQTEYGEDGFNFIDHEGVPSVEFRISTWLLDQGDNRKLLKRYIQDPPEPYMPLFDAPKVEISDQKRAILRGEKPIAPSLSSQNSDSDDEWKRLAEIGEQLSDEVFTPETEYDEQ